VGLVKQVTSQETCLEVHASHMNVSVALKDLNARRRIRRMRRVVVAGSQASVAQFSGRGERYRVLFVTLTYRENAEWDRKQIARYVQRVRDRALSQGYAVSYQWVLELTKRGRPHYHVIWYVPAECFLRQADRAGDWGQGFSQTARAKNPVGYVIKYASKGADSCQLGTIPRHARLFGVGGASYDERHATHRAGLPLWLDASLHPDARGRRVVRAGWVDTVTGEIHPSPFRVRWDRDDFGLVVITITQISEIVPYVAH
jgi:hypothetical protein